MTGNQVSTRLVEAASQALATRTSRRGFLRRVAVVGSALVTAPATYILRPISAYAAVVPGNCPGGARCRDGYTEFCCSIDRRQYLSPRHRRIRLVAGRGIGVLRRRAPGTTWIATTPAAVPAAVAAPAPAAPNASAGCAHAPTTTATSAKSTVSGSATANATSTSAAWGRSCAGS